MVDTSPDAIRILHVDDEPALADVVAEFLEREDERMTVRTATSTSEGLSLLAAHDVDCVVSDYDMPGQNGIDFLREVREDYPDIPFILFTGKGSEEVASEAISAGVTDYLQKGSGTDQYTVLANRIENAVDQYRTREALEANQKRLSLFVEQSPLGVIEWDDDFEVVSVNEAAEEILGYREAELVGRSWEAIVPEDDRDAVSTVVEELLDAEGGYHSVNENVRKDGERIVCEWHNRVVTDESGRTVAIFSQFQDITERTEREERLQRSTARLTALFENSPDMINVHDAAGNIIDPNPPLCEKTGYSEAELTGMKVWEIDQSIDPEEARDLWETMAVGERRKLEGTYRRRDGSTFPVEVHVRRLDLEDGDRFVVISRDVSEREQRQRELRETRERLDLAVEATNTGIWEWNLETDEVVWNETLERTLGLDPGTFEGTLEAFERRVHPEDLPDVRAALDRAIEQDELYRAEFRMYHDDGDVVWAGVRGQIVEGDDGGRRMVGIHQDVTERKERERKLEQMRDRVRGVLYAETVEEASRRAVAAADDVIDAPLSGVHVLSDDETTLQPTAVADSVSEVFPDGPTFDRDDPPGSRGALAWDVYRGGEPLHVGELSSFDRLTAETPAESVVLHPLGDHGLFVISSPDAHAFSETDRLLAEVLANNLEVALDRVEREQTLRTREDRLKLLHDATRDLVQADSRDDIVDQLAEAAETILEFPIASVRLYDPDAGGLVPAAGTDAVSDLVPERTVFTPEDGSLNWAAYEAGEVAVYPDAAALDAGVDQGAGLRSLMILPMGEYGTIAVGDTEPAAFDETDEILARILATAGETALYAHDQTRRLQRRQDELERQNERLEQFANIVSHDLRNPLEVANAGVELARAECDSPQLDKIERAHDRIETLVDDLLTLARADRGVAGREPVDLRTLAEESWEVVETAGATLVVDAERTVLGDRTRLKQVFENLFRNAVEHGGPEVTVTVGDLPDGFYVADDGVGIPEEIRDVVFEAGSSTSEAGTGVGLSIVSRIADAHDWTVSVAESEDGGARFEFRGVERPQGE